MHSSRMRTGRALTISVGGAGGGGGGCIPEEILGKKDLKRKEKKFGKKKILETPRKIGDPQKFGDTPKIWRHSLKIWRHLPPPTPEKLETPKKFGDPPGPYTPQDPPC